MVSHFISVTPPQIVFFGNERVNPGQNTVFNCTVAAFPTPHEDNITLAGPPQKRGIRFVSSHKLNKILYTRTNIFQVRVTNCISFFFFFFAWQTAVESRRE